MEVGQFHRQKSHSSVLLTGSLQSELVWRFAQKQGPGSGVDSEVGWSWSGVGLLEPLLGSVAVQTAGRSFTSSSHSLFDFC